MAGGKGGRECPILLVAASAEDFVQGAARKTATRQDPIDRGESKRHHPVRRRCRPLDLPDPFAECQQKIARHDSMKPNHVSYLFFYGWVVNPCGRSSVVRPDPMASSLL